MNRLHFAVLALLVPMSTGCLTAVEVELPAEAPVLAVDARFSPETPWNVLLQRTVPVDAETPLGPVPVTDAVVRVTGDDGTRVDLRHAGGGLYLATATPISGITYTLFAEAPGLPPVQATDTVPEPPRVSDDSASQLTLHDPVGPNAYEVLKLNAYGSFGGFWMLNAELRGQLQAVYGSDPLEPDTGPVYVEYALFGDAAFDGQAYAVRTDDAEWSTTTHVRAVSPAYAAFMRAARDQADAQDDPFVEPFSAPSNVEGGQGVFAAYTTTVLGEQSEMTLRYAVHGAYQLHGFSYKYFNADRDLIVAGARGTLTLAPDLTAHGHLVVPPLQDGMDTLHVDLTGAYRIEGNVVRLYHGDGSLVAHQPFYLRDGRLSLDLALGPRESIHIHW